MTRIVVVVQARTGSSRLPNKVLAPVVGGETVLVRMLDRVAAATTPTAFVLATTTDSSDDPIVALGHRAGWRFERGHPLDLLDRHRQAATAERAEIVVKIPSDCPLIDPAIVDRVIGAFDEHRHDFVSNLHPPTWPDGNDVEVMTMAALETAWRDAKKPLEREHTTPFIWDQPERFRCHNVRWETGLDYSQSHRFVLDYAEDLDLIRTIYAALWQPQRHFTLQEVLDLVAQRPELLTINGAHLGVSWYRNHPGELK